MMNTCHRKKRVPERKKKCRSITENSLAASSEKKSREEYPALGDQPSSPPWQATRSNCAPRPQSPHPRDPATGAGMELFPAGGYRNLSSRTPSRRSSQRIDNCDVLARAVGQRPCPSRRRRIHAVLLGNPCPWRLGGECTVSKRRRAGLVVLGLVVLLLQMARARELNS